jgi:peptide deformylase
MDGCLSFPGWFGYTVRPHTLRVQSLKADGQPFTHTFREYDAVLVHHEIDHLEGVLFIDHIRNPEDLFRFHADAQGKRVKVPLSAL